MSLDKYVLLFQNGDSVRELVEIPMKNRADKLIGVTRYTDFEAPNRLPAGRKTPYELNGTYPIVAADQFNKLYGKMLQLCDAMLADPTQREAFKSLVKENLSDWYDKETGYVYKMTEQLFNK